MKYQLKYYNAAPTNTPFLCRIAVKFFAYFSDKQIAYRFE